MAALDDNVQIQHERLFPLQMDYLPDFFMRKCEVELKETPQNKERGMLELKTMIEKNEMTKGYGFEDDLLVQYLRHSKYDVQRAFNHLQKYIAQRINHRHLFKSIPDSHCKHLAEVIYPLPRRTADGCTLILTRAGRWNPKEMEVNDFMRSSMMIFLQLMRDPMTQINGFKVIHDFGESSWRLYRHCTPHNLHFLFYTILDCIPGRYKEIHFINESFVMKVVWSIIRKILSEKILSRVHFHSNPEKLLHFFPSSVLPVEYGGQLKDFCMEKWLSKANKDHEANTIKGQPNFY